MKNDSTATVDREVPDVDEGADLATRPWAMTKIDPHAALVAFEAAAELLRKLTPASIKATRPQDWVKMGEKVYLQATGVERIAPLWGLYFGTPTINREDYEGGEFAYIVTGTIGSRFTGIEITVEGARSSSDPFFDSFDEEKTKENFWDRTSEERETWKRRHRVAPDPMDVRKAAVTNWMTRGASMLTGLRGLMPRDLEDNGIKGVASVEYGKGQKGGATATGDLTARRTALWNDILKRTSGKVDEAHQVLKDITKYDSYVNKTTGKQVPAGPGASNTDSLSERALQIAEKKLREHPVFGDSPEGREPEEA